MLFNDRMSAGVELGEELIRRIGSGSDFLVIGLARGGIPVAYGISKAVGAPLDVLVVRKLGVPTQEELAFGAIAPDGVRVINQDVVDVWHLSPRDCAEIEHRQRQQIEERQRHYRSGLPPLDVANKFVILVDDGLATGATMHAAIEWAKLHGATRRIVATPVASRQAYESIEATGTMCVCLATPEPFFAVGNWYHDFEQVDDEEVIMLLERRRTEMAKYISPERPDELNR